MVAARHVGAQGEPRRQRQLGERPARVRRDRPGPDRIAAERAELVDELEVPVERAVLPEQPRAERVALLARCALREFVVGALESEVVQADEQPWDEGDATGPVDSPERRVAVAAVVEEAGVDAYGPSDPAVDLPARDVRQRARRVEGEPVVR